MGSKEKQPIKEFDSNHFELLGIHIDRHNIGSIKFTANLEFDPIANIYTGEGQEQSLGQFKLKGKQIENDSGKLLVLVKTYIPIGSHDEASTDQDILQVLEIPHYPNNAHKGLWTFIPKGISLDSAINLLNSSEEKNLYEHGGTVMFKMSNKLTSDNLKQLTQEDIYPPSTQKQYRSPFNSNGQYQGKDFELFKIPPIVTNTQEYIKKVSTFGQKEDQLIANFIFGK